MKLLYCPDLNSVKAIAAQLQRPANDVSTLRSTVEPILADIKINGDAALKKYTLQFDGVELESLIFEIPTEINLDATLKTAIDRAYRNIFEFNNAQIREELPVETMKGIVCYRKSVAIERFVYSWWNSSAFFNGVDVGDSCADCGLLRNCVVYSAE